MRLTVLGSGASYPGAGRACAGCLVQTMDASVLLDCGNGVIGNLACVMDPTELDALVISHGHPDHFADVYALYAALRYRPEGPAAPLSLWSPPGVLERVGAALGDNGVGELSQAFEVNELLACRPWDVGDISLVPHPVDHIPYTFALFLAAGEATMCYTADTRLGAAVRKAAEGAATVVAEATLPEQYSGRAAHMTPSEAATLAEDVGAKTLVLTHLWPTVDRAAALRDARSRFSGRVIVADEHTSLDID